MIDKAFREELIKSNFIRRPLKVNYEEEATKRWKNKKVLSSRQLDDLCDPSKWTAHGRAEICFPQDVQMDGHRVVRMITPTYGERTPGSASRYYASYIERKFDGEDWSQYNRISFWVYPNLPGFRTISLVMNLRNDGTVKVPDRYDHDGKEFLILKPGEWNHIVCEIPHLCRDRITSINFLYLLCGNEPEAADRISFDFANIQLQTVEADYYEGWGVAPGHIAFSHTGYLTGLSKTAIASGLMADKFSLLEAETGKVVLTKKISTKNYHNGEYQILDFSEVNREGTYFIQVGDQITRTFQIGNHVWERSIWKTLNFFFCERCGMAIPGIHGVCHQDCMVIHGDKSISVNGGWHDAGDLSQGLVNTSEAVYAMLVLSQQVADINPEMSERLLEEARWGLDWVLKTRFGDGYRLVWTGMHTWTDGIIGTNDEVISRASNSPYETLIAIAAEAAASRILAKEDPILADYCKRVAQEDWGFAMENISHENISLLSQAVLAAVELYRITGDQQYIDAAVRYSRFIMDSQQRELPDWDIPIRGFFYHSPAKDRILHYEHRGHEQAPVIALVELCKILPDHPMREEWYASVKMYGEYMKKIAEYTQPYGMLPASIYDINDIPRRSDSTYQDQVRNGIRLSENHYLRLFPVWTNMRGNSGTVLSQAKGLSAAAHLLKDKELIELCHRQLEWIVGRNPFCESLMYGEGYDYEPQYTFSCGDIVGSLPVGVPTREEKDIPYWPSANCYVYKEVWVHPSSRWLWLMEDMIGYIKRGGFDL